MFRATRRLALLAALCSTPLVSTFAHAQQDYPSREIRAICNFGVGTGADILVRYYSDQLSKLTGKPVIVENRPGANGNVASDAVAKSKPDGYTIMITPGSSTLAAAPHLTRKMPFDPVKDFAPVTTVLSLAFGVIVSAALPVNNIAELTEYLKKKPNNGTFGTSNNTGLVGAELYKERAGLKSLSVPYKTTPQAMTDLLSGQLDFVVADGTFINQQIRGGKIKLLAVTSANRTTAFPNVPTMAESGFPGFDLIAWWGVVVPAGTPKPIVDKLESLFNQIAVSDDTRKFLAIAASDVLPGNQAKMGALIKNDMDRWAGYVKLANIQPE
jgi:tripartite-type tricarboxylate transporter receptor subunit TctC